MRIHFQRIGLAATLAIGLSLGHSFANPTSKEPNRPIAAHGTIEGAEQLVAELYQLHDEEEKLVIQYHDSRDNPTRWSDRLIAKSAGRLWKARRDASHLRLMGEPAAVDLERKLALLAAQVDGFGLGYRGTPKGTQLIPRIQNNLRREAQGMTRFLEQASRALQQGKLEIFETQMEKKGVELYEQLVFFSPSARKPYNAKFNALLGQGDALLSEKRKKQYRETASAILTQHTAAANQLAAEAKRIAGEIAQTGTAKLTDDKSGNAEDAFAHVVTLWGNASAGLARAAAIQWAFTDRARVQVQPSPEQLKTAAMASLAAIVEAAAQSTPPENVQATYSGLLQQISVADRRIATFNDEVFEACEPALKKLAAKEPALAKRVERYERATTEVLKWRGQYARQQSENLERLFPIANSRLGSQGEVPNIRPSYVRNALRKTTIAPNMFIAPANWMVQEAASNLIGQPVSEEMTLRLSPTSQTAVAPFDGLHFANVRVSMPSDPQVADLMTAIVVDEQHGPLTRESADAVSAAKMHDYVHVGGLIEQVHLESVVSRFVRLPDLASPLVPLGKLPDINVETSPLLQTCWRIDIRPVWARHSHFTVRAQAK